MEKGGILHYTNLISQLFEKISHFAFYPKIQILINKFYIRIFNINMEGFDTLQSYPTLNALFTRSLVKMRSFDKSEVAMIAPCDSVVMESGVCKENLAMQIKGKSYKIDDFIHHKIDENFFYVNFYLSPSDYHRFHAPIDLWVKKIAFIQGLLLPVNERSLYKNENLFIKNKRVVLECEDEFGNDLYYVAVGALNVGKIQINLESKIANLKENESFCYEKPIFVKKGDELGCFQMGSTIVMFSKNWEYNLKIKEKVLFGQQIAQYKG